MSQLAQVVQLLEDRNVRLTPPRLAVLAAAAAAAERFSAEEIQRELPRVGRATIFRTLKLLVDADIICRVIQDDGRLLYRWSRRGHHHHLVCRTCGATRDISQCGIPELLGEAARVAGFAMEGHWLEVYGRCQRCLAGEGERPALDAKRATGAAPRSEEVTSVTGAA